VGSSILHNIGLSELVGQSADEYVNIAVTFAQDRQRLAGLRRTLRDRMRHSPLMDEAGFARELEAAYRNLWRSWCESHVSHAKKTNGPV
jgi:predicted O-linked N-acetylglucosamine transferase (SPINDLY family)